MFEYSCTSSHLANWVFSQVSDQHGVIFPKRKGWTFFLRAFYSGKSDQSMLQVLVANRSECIVFVPIDESIPNSQIRSAVHPGSLSGLRSELRSLSCQMILLTCENQSERIGRLLDRKKIVCPLLVLSAEGVGFKRGNFNNPRLEFRLSQLDYDPDLIPGFLHDTHFLSPENRNKSLYFQNLFHYINRMQLNGNEKMPLRQLVGRSIPCWRQFRRAEQKKILERIQTELQTVADRFLREWMTLSMVQKKPDSQPEAMIVFNAPSDIRSNQARWIRKQQEALKFLKQPRKPLTIEELELHLN